jgi:hypothetical protein
MVPGDHEVPVVEPRHRRAALISGGGRVDAELGRDGRAARVEAAHGHVHVRVVARVDRRAAPDDDEAAAAVGLDVRRGLEEIGGAADAELAGERRT